MAEDVFENTTPAEPLRRSWQRPAEVPGPSSPFRCPAAEAAGMGILLARCLEPPRLPSKVLSVVRCGAGAKYPARRAAMRTDGNIRPLDRSRRWQSPARQVKTTCQVRRRLNRGGQYLGRHPSPSPPRINQVCLFRPAGRKRSWWRTALNWASSGADRWGGLRIPGLLRGEGSAGIDSKQAIKSPWLTAGDNDIAPVIRTVRPNKIAQRLQLRHVASGSVGGSRRSISLKPIFAKGPHVSRSARNIMKFRRRRPGAGWLAEVDQLLPLNPTASFAVLSSLKTSRASFCRRSTTSACAACTSSRSIIVAKEFGGRVGAAASRGPSHGCTDSAMTP